ncbi:MULTISPECIES: hypothetical protein [unclassified Aliiroseovarius]|uniref:hypothetical protein n=1 Tax=unclassified Aliiroseovarius TaxID=2623558 RepID=UPI001569BA8E|nr:MULTISPECIES: hypothetical protein [unclassified Aliiroseovarius]
MTLDVTQKCLRKNKNNKKGMVQMDEIEVEYEIVKMLAEKRWKLQQQLAEVEAAIAKNSHNFVVGDDGLLEVGLGVADAR